MARRLDKSLVWLGGEIKTPPLSAAARIEAGVLLRRLQTGELLAMPHSRPMPAIGPRCHELRINDRDRTWRVMYRVDPDAIVIPRGVQQEDSGYARCRRHDLSGSRCQV